MLRDGTGVLLALGLGCLVCVGSHWLRDTVETPSPDDRLPRAEGDRMRLQWIKAQDAERDAARQLEAALVTIGAQREVILLLAGEVADPVALDAARRAAPRLGDSPEDKIPAQNIPTGNE